MSSRMHCVVAHTVGYLYASVGFFLSVLSILFNLLSPKTASSSEDASTTLTAALGRRHIRRLQASTENFHREITITRATTSDSEATRVITPVPTPVQHTENPFPPSLKRKPTVIAFVAEMDTNSIFTPRTSTSSERVLVHSDCDEPNRSFLSYLFPLRKKRSKLHRCTAPPHLSSPHLTPKSPPPLPHQDKPQEHRPIKKRRSTLYKDSRTPAGSGTARRSVSCPPVKKNSVEKKKSQILRTQPYEAPYFFPPPIPSRSGT